jgi:uridine kinase
MPNQTIILGIAGPSASGKSLLSKTIVEELGSDQVVIISEDSYYKSRTHLSMEERAKINYDHPDAFEHDLLHEHLQQLRAGRTVHVPLYDYTIHDRSEKTREIGPYTIIVLEGILLLSQSTIREMLDISIFMDTPLDMCLIRRLYRDVKERGRDLDSVLSQYESTVRPMYHQFIEPSKRYADIIIPRGGRNRIAIDVIKAQMREILLKA